MNDNSASKKSRENLRVGFIGLGSQGGPMARRIVESGFPTTLWARRPAGLESYRSTTAAVAASPAELGKSSDVVCICVVDDAGVEAVLTGEAGVLQGMEPGGIIAIHSTVHPDTCRRLGDVAAQVGITLIDAPVSGGGIAADERRLLVMVGGDAAAVDTVRPVFDTYADPIVHMGELGSGQVAKLLNNTVLAAQIGTAASVLQIGESLGVDAVRLADVIAHGTGASFAMTVVGPSGGRLAALSQHVGPLLLKDVGILADVVTASGLSPHGVFWDAADAALEQLLHPRIGAAVSSGPASTSFEQ